MVAVEDELVQVVDALVVGVLMLVVLVIDLLVEGGFLVGDVVLVEDVLMLVVLVIDLLVEGGFLVGDVVLVEDVLMLVVLVIDLLVEGGGCADASSAGGRPPGGEGCVCGRRPCGGHTGAGGSGMKTGG